MSLFKEEVEYKDRITGDIRTKEEWSERGVTIAFAIAIFAVILLFFGGCSATLTKPDAGYIGVARNGGPFDGKSIRTVIQPNTGLGYYGQFTTVHWYPVTQRNYIIAANSQDTPGADEFQTPTKDSVNVGVDAQVYFTLNTDENILKLFDNKYGTRTNPWNGHSYYPYEGNDGWNALLASYMRPVIHNALREEVAQFNCAELNAQCALLKTSSNIKTVSGNTTNVNFTKIQDALKDSLQNDLRVTLGGEFFEIQKVNLTAVKLPAASQAAVDTANAAKAEVSTEKQKAIQAKYKAEATQAQARANRANPFAGLQSVCAVSKNCIVNLGGSGLNLGFNK